VLSLIRDFNLVATTYRRAEGHASSELRYVLEQAGDATAVVDRTGISGVIVAKTALNPFEAIGKFREILKERPYEFRYLLRIVPVEKVVQTDLDQVQSAVKELSLKILENETFRVTVEKRFTTLPSRELVESAASVVKRIVNLSEPQQIILIEVLGGLTGVAVTKPEGILSILKEKIL